LIDKELTALLPEKSAAPKKLHAAMRYSVFSGGKRIRPILAIESCLCCGGSISGVLRAACAIELVHTFSLIHDDLPAMDDDDYRRGKPTCHKKFGEATAILAGDALLSLALEIMASGRNPGAEIKLIKELTSSIGSLGMAGGQCVDIEYEGKKKD
jgi:geranylgeranyl diphosphate synthase type II